MVHTEKSRLGKIVFGALNMRTSRIYWKHADKGNSQQFIMFLHQLHKANPDKKMMIILDNSPIHKSKKVQRFLQKHPWVELFFLSPYSPEYNPIERFWH
ncbi:transposase [Legionella tucsonensis]